MQMYGNYVHEASFITIESTDGMIKVHKIAYFCNLL